MTFSKLKASQTKYNNPIVEAAVNNELESYIGAGRKGGVDPPVLKAYLGIDDIESSPLPQFWKDLKAYSKEIRGLFGAIAYIFIHNKSISEFAEFSEEGKGRGTFVETERGRKVFTNIRIALITGFAVDEKFARSESVPYNFTKLFEDGDAGKLAKDFFTLRLGEIGWKEAETSDFYRDFYPQCFHFGFHKALGLTESQFKEWLEGKALSFDAKDNATLKDLNIDLEKEVEINSKVLLSLAAKPFLILSGPSGTGKTLGIRTLARDLNPVEEDPHFNITFIPVEAGWKDGRFISGYRNPFGQDGEFYQSTPLVEMMLKANMPQYEHVPFFVVFDEMNLSHVEMYFAKFLSLIESSRHDKLKKQPLLNVEELELLAKPFKKDYEKSVLINNAISEGGLYISDNIFFVGTVNIDETTYMFSPKVLDRAFVIEMKTKSPLDFNKQADIPEEDKITLSLEICYQFLKSKVEDLELDQGFLENLDSVYKKLEDFKFGDRVVKEALVYRSKSQGLGEGDFWTKDENKVFDQILLQKILPKIHGNRKQLAHILKELEGFTKNTYPLSNAKIEQMIRLLTNTGYTSFIV